MTDSIRIGPKERERLASGESTDFPKYTSPIINLANNYAKSTTPRYVGTISELVPKFRREHPDGTFDDWREFYYNECDGADRIDTATERTMAMLQNFREAIEEIDEEMVKEWTADLILYKSYMGFDIQEVILTRLAEEYDDTYSQSTPAEESKGIDGYIGSQPVSVKPDTYKQQQLQEEIQAPIVYYEDYENSDALKLDIAEFDRAVGDN